MLPTLVDGLPRRAGWVYEPSANCASAEWRRSTWPWDPLGCHGNDRPTGYRAGADAGPAVAASRDLGRRRACRRGALPRADAYGVVTARVGASGALPRCLV